MPTHISVYIMRWYTITPDHRHHLELDTVFTIWQVYHICLILLHYVRKWQWYQGFHSYNILDDIVQLYKTYSYTALYTKIASCTQILNAPWISQTSDSWNICIYTTCTIMLYTRISSCTPNTVHPSRVGSK